MAVMYNVIRGDGVFFEGMTKEQIYELIAEVTGQTAQDIDQAFITKLKEINKGNNIRLWLGTSAEYNALTTKEEDVLYICTDDTFVQDTNAEVEKIWKKIDANYQTVDNRLTAQDKNIEDFKNEVNQKMEDADNTLLKTFDNGSVTALTGTTRTVALPQCPIVGRLYKISWRANGTPDDYSYANNSGGGFVIPDGVYKCIAYDDRYTYWEGDRDDGSRIYEDDKYFDLGIVHGGDIVQGNNTMADRSSYHLNNGWIMLWRIA